MRIQSTIILPPPTVRSLTRGRIGTAKEIVCVTTTAPSILKTTVEAFHSIRNRWGAPMKDEESVVLFVLEPLLVRAANAPLLMMLKMAQFGFGLKSTPNPT